ncbi:MAG: PAS domain-containing sensor histidine kinase [Chitinophagaceae bacterium]|nr:PAS domain-containing sensor histidine kinase [Chitinophagaceae bacterium]
MLPSSRNSINDFLQFEALFNHASIGILIVNSNGIIQSLNPFALSLFGYTSGEIIGQPIEVLIPKRLHHVHVNHRNYFIEMLGRRPMGIGMELLAVKNEGTELQVEVSLDKYVHEGETKAIIFVSDISVRKKAEAEIIQLKEELESSVEKRTADLTETLRQLEISRSDLQKAISLQNALLSNVGAIIVTVDTNGIIQTFNSEAEKELLYTADELVGKHTPLIFLEPSMVAKQTKELSAELQMEITGPMELLLAKAGLGLKNEDEWVYVRKDGTTFPVQLNISAMRNDGGVIIGFVGVSFDISKIKMFEQELQQSLEKEKELNLLKSRFVSMASHEFRTPLSTILSSTYLIEKYTSTEAQPRRAKHLQRIISSVNMLTDILNDFLSVGMIEEGKIQVRPARFNIEELIKEIADEIMNTLKKDQLILCQHEGNSELVLDPSLLKHIIMNLVSNAGKFSAEGSPIEINTIGSNDCTILSIKDHGIGISKEDQDHLMERFYRGTNASNIQGTGLGLHIVSKYAELLNGTIACKSELGVGTEFILTFNTKSG